MVTVAMAFPDGRGGQAGRYRHASGNDLLKLADPKRLEKSWVRTFPRKNPGSQSGGVEGCPMSQPIPAKGDRSDSRLRDGLGPWLALVGILAAAVLLLRYEGRL